MRFMLRWRAMLCGLTALLALPILPAAGAQLQVAVAANFLATLQALAPQFAQASGDTLLLSAGSTGQLYAQIKQGAPFDMFLSADTERPALLQSQGLTVSGSRFTYATGTLVLWSPHAGVVDSAGRVLTAGHYHFIALSDPATAPYGTAARQVLNALGLWNRLEQAKQIILGENVTQTWQFAASGNVDMAFVALSQVLGADGRVSGSYWEPPQSLYTPIDQDAVVLAHSPKRAAALAFAHWLRTDPAALATIKAAGYRTHAD